MRLFYALRARFHYSWYHASFWAEITMNTTPSLPTYIEVANALKKTQVKHNAAQAHGLMCGLICATTGKQDTRWQPLLLGNKPNEMAKEILERLYEDSYHQMSEFSFEFTLLLPNDKTDLNTRAEALGLWCQGFITGLEQGEVQIKNRTPGEVTEAINDIIEISQVNYSDIAENDEDETAYFELVEYVRLATLMIFHDLRHKQPQSNTLVLH